MVWGVAWQVMQAAHAQNNAAAAQAIANSMAALGLPPSISVSVTVQGDRDRDHGGRDRDRYATYLSYLVIQVSYLATLVN